LRVERAHGCWSVVGVSNWSDAPIRAELRLAAFGLETQRQHVVDQWTGEYLGVASEKMDLGPLAPHAMRLLALHPDLGRPRTIGSTGHLLGDAMDLASEAWDAAARVLTLRPSGGGPPARRGELIVYDPHGPPRRVPFSGASTEPLHLQFG
jgi:hypothetical protein